MGCPYPGASANLTLREMVVRQLEAVLSDEECVLYASQLVQATKWDAHDFNALARCLLRKALESVGFAHALYWQLQVSVAGGGEA